MKSFLLCRRDENSVIEYYTSQPFRCPNVPYFTFARDFATKFNVNDFDEKLISFIAARQLFLIET